MTSKHLVLSVAIVIPILVSCDDGGSKGSGVASDKLLKDLTEADYQKVCRWNIGQFKSLEGVGLRQVCTFEEAPFSSSEAECKEAVSDCVAAADGEDGEDIDEDSCEDQEKPDLAAGCNGITVADYENCVEGLVSGTKRVFKSVSCADYGEEPDYGQAAEEVDDQCKTILNRCPSFLPSFLAEDEGDEPPFDFDDE